MTLQSSQRKNPLTAAASSADSVHQPLCAANALHKAIATTTNVSTTNELMPPRRIRRIAAPRSISVIYSPAQALLDTIHGLLSANCAAERPASGEVGVVVGSHVLTFRGTVCDDPRGVRSRSRRRQFWSSSGWKSSA